jgi:methyl-accepting chemotaxis protein
MRASAMQARDRIGTLSPKVTASKLTISKLCEALELAVAETLAVDAVLGKLETSGQRIVKIVDGIALVAVQTNMLAVSGSVEAARAREFGRGFAVVSSDIRNLSRQSADNAGRAKDVALSIHIQLAAVRRDLELIASISQAEGRKNQVVVDRLGIVEVELASLGQASVEIVTASESILTSVRQVLAGTQQIASASEEASGAASQAATAARQQAQGAEDLAAAIEEIASLADELQSTKS